MPGIYNMLLQTWVKLTIIEGILPIYEKITKKLIIWVVYSHHGSVRGIHDVKDKRDKPRVLIPVFSYEL